MKQTINLFLIILHFIITLSSVYAFERYQFNYKNYMQFEYKTIQQNWFNNPSDMKIYIQSDTINFFYPKKIKLSGHVHIKQNNNIIKSDELTIFNINTNNLLNSTLFANGNIHYNNNFIVLTASHAQFKLYNKNANLYKSTYYLLKSHIHGSAQMIMQRENNRYTIIKKGDLTSCFSTKDYWKIIGSEIMYDHLNNKINIWNAHLKIKKIPIFYWPYLSFPINTPNILKHSLPNIQYSNKYGLLLQIPFPLNFSKYYSGNITPYYMSDTGIILKTNMFYTIKPGNGLFTLNIIENYNKNNYLYNKFYTLYWKHNGIIHRKWNLNFDYISNNDLIYNRTHNQNCIYSFHDYINQKFLCSYNDKNWKTSIAYLGVSDVYKKMMPKKNIYTAAPQIELYIYRNNFPNNLFNFKIFNQFTNFIPSDHTYPNSIRIHTEPILNFYTTKHWLKLNAESKLKITYYQQKNINHYNTNRYHQHQLQNKITRIIPQFKINGKILSRNNKIQNIKQYQYFIEPKLQYLYCPYRFQENIGLYDTKKIYINHNTLFHGAIYSGLDRIAHVHQIAGEIIIRLFHKNNELFYTSIGKILNLPQFNIIRKKKNKQPFDTDYINNTNFFLGVGQWNINNLWNVNTEIQYNILFKKISFNNIALEYNNNNNKIFQIHYRYINAQHLKTNLINYADQSIYYQSISQLGMLTYYPITNHWRIQYTQHHNIKTNHLVNQTIGIQHLTPCWVISLLFERKIIGWNNTLQKNIYDSKILLHLNIYNSKLNFQLDPHKTLNINTIPYQSIR